MSRQRIDPSLDMTRIDMTRYISDPKFIQAMALTDPLTLQRLRLNRQINTEMNAQGVVYRRGNPIYEDYTIDNPLALDQVRRRKRVRHPLRIKMNDDFFERLEFLTYPVSNHASRAYTATNPLKNIDEDYLLNNVLQIQGQPNKNPNFIANDMAALRFCSSRNYIRCVQRLLDDPRVNIHADGDWSLRAAISRQYLSLAEFLISKGANVNSINAYGALRNKDGMELLLRNGFDINKDFGECVKVACNSSMSDYPIMFPDALKFVLDHGARVDDASLMNPDPTADDEEQQHPFNLIIDDADDDIESLLIKNISLLLDYGVDIHRGQDMALHLSIIHRLYALAKVLIQRGANIHSRNDQALMTSIQLSETENNAEFIKYLIDQGANVNAQNNRALLLSINLHMHKWDIVKLLIDHGADVQAHNNAAAKRALEERNGPMIMYLIQKGAVLD